MLAGACNSNAYWHHASDRSLSMDANSQTHCLRALRHAAAELLVLIEAEESPETADADREKARLISQFIRDADHRLQLN
jgi:hypothetical protein